MKNKKLGIIVPYRNRYDHLQIFKRKIKEYLEFKNLDYELIIIEQDDAKNFNRGKLLNIGFTYAKKLKCDYVVFHDVDMLPVEVDYSYSEIPIHLATNFVTNSSTSRIIFDEYFGGVTLFPVFDFEKINGYSNEYWGWGFEDDDLLYRCKINNIPLSSKEITNAGGNTAALRFNGSNSFVKTRTYLDVVNDPITIFISFYPDDLTLDVQKLDDKFTVFSIPELNLSLNYSSFKRYNFEINPFNENFVYINSDIEINYKTNLTAVINPDSRVVKLYQDGKILEQKDYIPQEKSKSFFTTYLGCFEENNFFKGVINSVAIFNKELNSNEILELAKNQYFGLSHDFENYKSSENLVSYYDAKFIRDYKLINLGKFKDNADINGCEIVGYEFDKTIQKPVPYRRKCTFKLLNHEENGYVNGTWKDITTRYNQLRFQNEVQKGYRDNNLDGLSDLNFTEHSHTRVKNQTHVVVGV
jgi:hypothetical protein